MEKFKNFISERVKLKLIRGKNMDVLKMRNKGDSKWVELRGKPGFENMILKILCIRQFKHLESLLIFQTL